MEDTNLVEIWLKKDPVRWKAGAIAGIFAGIVALAFAGVLSAVGGPEFWFPIKLAATPLLGPEATNLGLNVKSLVTGLISFEILAVILGVAYAHFTGTNSLPALLGMGLVWGAFSWIFINNLFTQSIKSLHYTDYSYGAAFFTWLVFGVSLTAVAFFDRMLRGSSAKS